MPSPKRIRLEAPEPHPALKSATPVDDMHHLYGIPPVKPQSPPTVSYVPAPALGTPAFPISQEPFQLPGLEIFNGNAPSSREILELRSQSSSFLDTEQSLPTGNMEDVEPEDEAEEKLQVNSGLNAAADCERLIIIQTTEYEGASPTAGDVHVNENATSISNSEEHVSKADAPVSQDVIRSGSELGQATLDWHSSGTVIDKGVRLHGNHSAENASSTTADSNDDIGGTHAEVLQVQDVDYNGEDVQTDLFSGAEPLIEQSKNTIFTEPTFEELAEANKDDEEAEFELDSSPFGSDSSSDDSNDTSSSDDSDADDYEMLSPAEQARRLMAEDGGSNDDGKGRKAVAEVPRTLNEKPDELVPKPTIAVTEDMKIEDLGLVENTVENLALIKAKTSGEYQVLETGSLLCLQDRSVIGVVSETLGRVQQPYYSVRFTNATAIAEAGIQKDTRIFYVAQHSTTVFTQPLKAFKGSDASNLHDEEVNNDELEFSDDEAEAEHKRQVKQQRMAKRNARDGQPDGFSRGPQQRPGGPVPRLNGGLPPVQEQPPNSAEATLNYDDADGVDVDDKEDGDDLYTPLTRPSNLHEMISGKAPPMDNNVRRGNAKRGRGDSKGGNRGRGESRGRGGDRGMRGTERGGKQNRKDYGNRGGKGYPFGNPSPPTPQTNGSSPPQINGLPPRPRPESIGYQRSTYQGNGFPHPPPQQLPMPPPPYQSQAQPVTRARPGYPSQYPNAYNQCYLQQPPHQNYPSHFPQQNYHQPQQSVSHQGYLQQFASQPDMSFPPGPQYPPHFTSRTPSLPPGAHINPNFYKQQGQASSPQGWQQGYQQQQASPASDSNSTGPTAPGSNAARLEELLRGLGR